MRAANAMTVVSAHTGKHVLLYDGLCGLCNRLVRFILKRDDTGKFRFASLQSAFGAEVLIRHGKNPEVVDTICLIPDYQGHPEQLLSKAPAALFVLRELGGIWRLATVLGWLPTSLLNLCYEQVARRRYAAFGQYTSCPLPEPRYQDRFIDV
jgi:predicted DCC family thiol-disulfide oxidoreductase YuxK